ncbi:MAG: UDP-3-O-acyl-N-acetylglucosamine deacetylase [Vulcanimicrobiaceae bacterium]
MSHQMNRFTLESEQRFSGIGLHSGANTTVTLRPAVAGTGLMFVLGDEHIPATAEYVVETSRATVIGRGSVSVSTVEHLLSSLYAFGVSDLHIVVDGPEIPVLDGSAKEFSTMLGRVGLRDLGEPAPTIAPTTAHFFADGDRLVIVLPADDLRVRFVADFPSPVGTQYLDFPCDAQRYADDIAAARTFGYLAEVEALKARGLALGGSLDNALVFDVDGPMQPLQWPNEVVRHKILDLLGDFALLGARLQAQVIAVKSGHALHSRVTKALRDHYVLGVGSI